MTMDFDYSTFWLRQQGDRSAALSPQRIAMGVSLLVRSEASTDIMINATARHLDLLGYT